jgi:hypothetical protein
MRPLHASVTGVLDGAAGPATAGPLTLRFLFLFFFCFCRAMFLSLRYWQQKTHPGPALGG